MQAIEAPFEESFLHRLQKELALRKQRNFQYSMRSFARSLSVSPSLLSSAFSGRRVIGESTAKKIAERIAKSNLEVEYLYLLIQRDRESSSPGKEAMNRRIKKLLVQQLPFEECSDSSAIRFAKWTTQALYELQRVPDYEPGLAWISKRLGISLDEAKAAKESVGRTHHTSQRTNLHLTKLPSFVLKQFHQKCLQLAFQAIQTQTPDERKSKTLTLAFHPSKLDLVEEKMVAFLKELSSLADDPIVTTVYQMNLQFFRLDEK